APLFAFCLIESIVFGIWWAVLRASSPIQKEIRARRKALESARQDLGHAYAHIHNIRQYHQQRFEKARITLDRVKTACAELDGKKHQEVRALHQHAREHQLEAYLRNCFISNARIQGIGPTRIATLESFGIETAFDVNFHTASLVPGFGPVL